MNRVDLPGEQWRPVLGWEDRCEVSNLGRVYSVGYVDARGRRRFPKMLKPTADPTGRRKVSLTREGVRWESRVYVLVLEAFVGPRPEGMYACHNDGDPGNDRLENLRWDTPAANNYDAVRHGTHGMAQRTECRRGHPLTDWNIVPHLWNYRNERACLACQRAKGNRRYALRMGRDIDVQATADEHFARIEADARAQGIALPCSCATSYRAAS